MQKDGLTDAFDQVAMGNFADATAREHQISREAQDAFAVASYTKSAAAWEAGKFKAEITPVSIKDRRKGEIVIAKDEEYSRSNGKNPRLTSCFFARRDSYCCQCLYH